MSRQIPPNDLKHCASCGRSKENYKIGWVAVTRGKDVLTYTCPLCPEWGEPIRLVAGRFRAVVTVTPRGEPQKQKTKTFTTLAAGRAFVAEVRASVSSGGYTAPKVTTVADLVKQWIDTRTDIRPGSRDGYRMQSVGMLRRIGHLPVADLRPIDVQAMTTWLEREGGKNGGPVSPRAVRAALTVLRQALNWAMVNDLVSRNVASPVKAPRQVKGKKAHWTREQMDTFRDVADADPLAACWRLTLLGLRVSEIRGLLWENVDLDAGEVKIRRSRVGDQEDDPKSVAGKRDIPVDRFEPGTAALLRALKRQQAADKLRCGSAWQDRKGHVMVDTIGQVISAEAYRDRFHRLCRTADLSTIDLHAVRHSFGTYLNTLSDHHDAHASVLGHTLNVFLSIYSQSAGREGIDRAAQAVENARSAV